MNIKYLFTAILVAIALSACNNSSSKKADRELERKLERYVDDLASGRRPLPKSERALQEEERLKHRTQEDNESNQ